jgi:hypothetical protein
MLWTFHIIWIHALATTVSHLGNVVICELIHFNWIHAGDELLAFCPFNVTVAYDNHCGNHHTTALITPNIRKDASCYLLYHNQAALQQIP